MYSNATGCMIAIAINWDLPCTTKNAPSKSHPRGIFYATKMIMLAYGVMLVLHQIQPENIYRWLDLPFSKEEEYHKGGMIYKWPNKTMHILFCTNNHIIIKPNKVFRFT